MVDLTPAIGQHSTVPSIMRFRFRSLRQQTTEYRVVRVLIGTTSYEGDVYVLLRHEVLVARIIERATISTRGLGESLELFVQMQPVVHCQTTAVIFFNYITVTSWVYRR